MLYVHGVKHLASFPVFPRTRFTFTCGGEHFETGKAWSETSREVDVGITLGRRHCHLASTYSILVL